MCQVRITFVKVMSSGGLTSLIGFWNQQVETIYGKNPKITSLSSPRAPKLPPPVQEEADESGSLPEVSQTRHLPENGSRPRSQ